MKEPAIYILTNRPNGTLYTGVTSDLAGRMNEHVRELHPGFSKKYKLKTLVYYDFFFEMDDAIKREKQLKNWNRTWKVDLILQANPEWKNLFDAETGTIHDLPSDERMDFLPRRTGHWERIS